MCVQYKRPPSDRWETANGGGESLFFFIFPQLYDYTARFLLFLSGLFFFGGFVCVVPLNKRKCLLMDDVMTARE